MKALGLSGAETHDALEFAVLCKRIGDSDLGLVVAWDPYGEQWCANVGTDRHLEADAGEFGDSALDALTQAARLAGVEV